MTPDRWQRVKDLFQAAVERDPRDRRAFLSGACGEDGALLAEVERLLSAHEHAASFIEGVPAGRDAVAAGMMRPSLTGLVIGRYEVGRLVGAGGMGEVYAARDLELGRAVALKVGIDGGSDAHSRLKREAQHASRLNHPNICTIHEVGSHDDQPFIIMELVEGRPLSDLLPADGLPVEEVVRYGTQIADAVAHAHRHRVTHRDLKSANVLITPEGRVKVLDFGLARGLPRESLESLSQSRASITAEGVVAGTLSVMAPEMLRGEPADERSDIWSLGVLLYEMACGERPFRGATGFELSGAILHAPPRPLPDRVPARLARVVYRCLEKNPRDRYQNAGEIRTALVVGESAPVPRALAPVVDSSARRFLSRCWRHRIAWLLAIVAAYGTYRIFLRPDSGPVAVGASGRPAIAVMHFENVGQPSDSAWLSSGVPSMLMTGLAQTQGLEIVSAGRLEQALRQKGGATFASLNRSEAADVARRAGAGAIVVGGIFRAGSEIRIDAQVEDLASGRVLAAESVRGTNVFALVDQLASEIRDAVGFADAQGVRGVANVSSTSLEAYRLYSEGMEAYGNARWPDADKLFKAAVAIDPSFAEAYQRLAGVSGALGRRTARQEYFKLALDHADRLPERQRLLLEAQMARERGDTAMAKRVLDEVLSKFPDVEEAYPFALQLYQTGYAAGANRQRLLEITAAGAATLPSSTHTRNVHGYALLNAGRYREAVGEFEAYARLAPREPNPYDSLGEAYLRMGDAEKAVEAYSRALTVDPAFPSRNLRAWSLAVLGRYDEAVPEQVEFAHLRALILSRVGRYREAAQVLAAGEKERMAIGDSARVAGLRLVAALLAIERKDYARALQQIPTADKLFEGPNDVQRSGRVLAHLLSGLAHIQAGRLSQALSQFEAQGRSYSGANELERSWRHSLEGEIALARGDLPQAATAFSASEPSFRIFNSDLPVPSVLVNDLPSRDGLARVAIARGDVDGAIKIYRALLVYGPNSKWIAPFEPLYVLQIARLLEKKGEGKAALDEYQRFLGFWKSADTDLPELAEARRAVARLK